MKKLYRGKIVLLCIMFVPMWFVYQHILTDFNAFETLKLHIWIVAFLLMLLFFYISVIMTTLIEFIIIKSFHLVKMKGLILYPFTYDGKLELHPIKLLYNKESFRDNISMNLTSLIDDENRVYDIFKKIINIHKVSSILAFCLLFVIYQNFTINILILFLLCLMSRILVTHFHYSDYWEGNAFILSQGKDYLICSLYKSRYIERISSQQYANYLRNHCNMLDKESLLSIMENYLLKSIIEKTTFLSVEDLKVYIQILNPENKVMSYHMGFDARFMQCKKLIGYVGIVCENERYIECSKELLRDIRNEMVNMNIAKKAITELNLYIAFLEKNKIDDNKIITSLYDTYFIFHYYKNCY